MSNKDQAAKIQKFLDWEYGIDIATFQNSELQRMATEIQKFLALGVETEDLSLADASDDGFVDDEDEEFDEDEDEEEFDDENDRSH